MFLFCFFFLKKKKKPIKTSAAYINRVTRLYPNKSQKEELNKWFGTAMWTYNQVVASLRASARDVSQYAVVKELRNDFVNKKNLQINLESQKPLTTLEMQH
jgi:hypothetical protein